jgi:hypothetical protein
MSIYSSLIRDYADDYVEDELLADALKRKERERRLQKISERDAILNALAAERMRGGPVTPKSRDLPNRTMYQKLAESATGPISGQLRTAMDMGTVTKSQVPFMIREAGRASGDPDLIGRLVQQANQTQAQMDMAPSQVIDLREDPRVGEWEAQRRLKREQFQEGQEQQRNLQEKSIQAEKELAEKRMEHETEKGKSQHEQKLAEIREYNKRFEGKTNVKQIEEQLKAKAWKDAEGDPDLFKEYYKKYINNYKYGDPDAGKSGVIDQMKKSMQSVIDAVGGAMSQGQRQAPPSTPPVQQTQSPQQTPQIDVEANERLRPYVEALSKYTGENVDNYLRNTPTSEIQARLEQLGPEYTGGYRPNQQVASTEAEREPTVTMRDVPQGETESILRDKIKNWYVQTGRRFTQENLKTLAGMDINALMAFIDEYKIA